MKILFIVVLTVVFLSACNSNAEKQIPDPSSISSFEVYASDTCNRTDINGRKQGKWYLYKNNGHRKIIDTIYYKDGKVIE